MFHFLDKIFCEKQNRKNWIDVIRGFCIFLVVMGHLTDNFYFHMYTNPIKMPMFYIIAGMFIKPEKKFVLI